VPEENRRLCGVLPPLLEDHRTMLAAHAARSTLAGKVAFNSKLAQIGVKRIIDRQIEMMGYACCADRGGRQSLHQSSDGL
jgi:hypothetical protein